ncbi:MAG TPA: amino acid permease [Chloroflexota bacterium]|nr:amino acid permease [Chloroflexota bacterium]
MAWADHATTLSRVKPMEVILSHAEEPEHRLKRSLGVVSLTAFGVAAIIGAGIFVLTGVAAATYAGPGITLSYVIAGIVSTLAALCYAELASTVPIAGSAYTYSYAVLGEFIAWIIGWDLVLEYGVGAGAVSVGWSGYFTDFFKSTFGITLPTALTASPFSQPGQPTGIANLPAAGIILLLTALLIRGTSESSRVNNVIVAIKVAIVLFFIAVGATHIHPANWHPFLPYGLGGVTTGASIIFFAYIGFDQISTAAEEARDPQRTMPRGIIYSLLICTLLYIAVAGILTGMVPYKQLNNASPVAHAMIQVGLNWAATIISVGALAGLTTVLLVLIFGQSRIFFSMSRDGLLPRVLSGVHPTFRTPYRSTLIVGVFVALLGAFTPIEVLAQLTNIGTLAAFVLVSLAVWRLRYTQPDLPRGFRVPWVPVLPILSALASLFLIVSLPGITIVRFVVWLAVGLIVYFAYSRHHSELQRRAGGAAPAV